jgi:hypothetical protein
MFWLSTEFIQSDVNFILVRFLTRNIDAIDRIVVYGLAYSPFSVIEFGPLYAVYFDMTHWQAYVLSFRYFPFN